MDFKKRLKKGQIVPDEEDRSKLFGSDNGSFQMDEMKGESTAPKKSPKFHEIAAALTNKKSNALKLISDVRLSAKAWRSYAATRRLPRKRLAKAEGDENEIGNINSGLGLDYIHADYTDYNTYSRLKHGNSSHMDAGAKTKIAKKDFDMTAASNRALLQYFAELGQSRKEDEVINLDFVHTLVASGADINCADKHGQTVLHEVARAWHRDVGLFLLEHGADPNKADLYGRTPLHVAAAVDYPEMVNLLIDKGADKEAKTFKENQTPVFYAAKTDAVQSSKTLIKRECLYKEERDYKGRTPIHVAAELDRSETARLLLELDAPCYFSDYQGQRAITWMITKMAPVAHEALNQFHMTDRPNRKQYFSLNHLVRDKANDPEGKAISPLHTVVTYRQFDLLMNPVFIRFLDVMWVKFGRFWALFNLGFNAAYIVMWTIIGIAVDYDKRHKYEMPDDIWRIVLYVLAMLLTVYQIVEEIMEFKRSLRLHEEYERRRTEDINRDLEFCHPRWPEEEKYLRQEIGELQDLKPKYFSDMWNIFDWLCYIMLIVCMITHIVDIARHSEQVARAHIRLMAVTIILLWLRLMKNARAFALLGPFIVMLGHMLKDCVRFLFLYMEFYIPFLAAFWMIFGGTKKAEANSEEEVVVDGYQYPGQLFFSMFRLTLVDEYDYGNMQKIDSVMADLLLSTWLLLSAVLCLNLFIALLSDTFQRVYDNAQANSVMQKAINILNTWDGINAQNKEKFLAHIDRCCSPLKDDYDDDMTQTGDEDVKKVTIQIKEELDNFQEMFKMRFGDPYSQLMSSGSANRGSIGNGGPGSKGELVSVQKLEHEMDGLRDTIKEVKDKQDDLAQKMTSDMTSVRSMLEQLLGKQPLLDEAGIRESPPPDYFQREETGLPELTPLSKMKKKKKKAKRPMSAGLEIDTLEDSSEISSRADSQRVFDVSEFSPGFIPDLTRTAPPQAFDVMLSPTSVPRPPSDSTKEAEDATNC
ncbi:transient receptor potential cation channel subfamily V member 1-like isoform X2 [Elysia marginata]|uniref:Transient receptor potential cation channel subfamily V member 1-like isoform X2 n=1 Tax=Elysia marginata TaxID=1093978 RepID=A0AAV4JK58_9GAST|nr:transient receptor potential cation channel subfamily V member 1-like isoform X2 [Elysia marginata]